MPEGQRLVAADAGRAALRKIAAASATFALLNILCLLVELRGLTQNGMTIATNTGRDCKFRRQINLMCAGPLTLVTMFQVLIKAS
jgi:hypothetical protein